MNRYSYIKPHSGNANEKILPTGATLLAQQRLSGYKPVPSGG